jgi:DNA-binding SARP family transcriptional activator
MATNLEHVVGTSQTAFEEQMRGMPLVIIHPRHRSRGALVAMILQVYRDNLVYYRLSQDETTLGAWLQRFATSDMSPSGLGEELADALRSHASPQDLAAVFGAALGALRPDRYMVLLDHIDLLKADDKMVRFFQTLPDCLPSHVQVVVNGRLLDLEPWNSLVLSGRAGVVGSDKAMDGGIYGEDSGRGQLEVFALSGGHVYADGKPVTSWDGSLPRHLFYYFVDHPMVTRDEIFGIFWPNMSVKEATNVFHVTKRKISERLGHELTNYASGFYVPSRKLSVHYDVRIFEGAVDQAGEFEDEAPRLWQLAVGLYRSDYLPYITMPWVRERREALRTKFAQALIGLGRHHRAQGEPEKALGLLLRALREKPDWEDVHKDVLSIYIEQGRRDDAAAQYRQLERTLDRMFGVKPGQNMRSMYDTIQAM